MSARQRLQKRKEALKHRKMSSVASLLEIPVLASPIPSYYSLTTIEGQGQGTVWSPSTRDYKRKNNFPLVSTPNPSNQKQKVLSPKHEEILQRQLKQDEEVGLRSRTSHISRSSTPISRILTPSNEKLKLSTNVNEAATLATLLETTPTQVAAEIYGQDKTRRRHSALEVGEEVSEDSMFSFENNSTLALHNPAVLSSSKNSIDTKQINITESKTVRLNSLNPNENKWKTNDEIEKCKCISAPGSPRGSRQRLVNQSSLHKLSKSLPIMFLTSPALGDNERKQRANRARAKAKSSNIHGSIKKLRR